MLTFRTRGESESSRATGNCRTRPGGTCGRKDCRLVLLSLRVSMLSAERFPPLFCRRGLTLDTTLALKADWRAPFPAANGM